MKKQRVYVRVSDLAGTGEPIWDNEKKVYRTQALHRTSLSLADVGSLVHDWARYLPDEDDL